MFLAIEVARVIELERRRESERRIPLLIAIRDNREQSSGQGPTRPTGPTASAGERTGPRSRSRTGTRYERA